VAGITIVRSNDEAQPEPTARSAVFRVLEGEGRWWTLTETDGSESEGEHYREIFRSADTKQVTESGRYVFVIRIDVAPDLDQAAFNDWYDHKHVPEVAPAGLRRGRRFSSDVPGWPYMAIYDMDARETLQSEALAKVRGFYEFTPQVTALERTVLERNSA
jgi:hypothetical protein